MIKRKPLPDDQSKVYVYTQDLIDEWKIEAIEEKKEEERQKHIDEVKKRSEKTSSDFQRLYMNEETKVKDFKVNEDE